MAVALLYFLLVIAVYDATAEATKCPIPGGVTGTCVESGSCAPYSQAIEARPLQHVEFLRHVQCQVKDGVEYVCCPGTGYYNFTEITRPTKIRERKPPVIELNNRFGEDDEDCGFQSGADRVFGGIITAIDEFPWMALIEYGKKLPDGSPILACGGVLIGKRYVLTAAHCVTGSGYETLGKIAKVRLGEYDLGAEKDCVVEVDYQDCADPLVVVGVDEVLVHPDYDAASRHQRNDIALLRLDANVNFTDFVKPICLPDDTERVAVRSGDVLQVAGWGKTERYAVNSPVKLKIGVPVIDTGDCQKAYKKYGITLSEKQICAGGERGKDSCKGDSGGPLMARNEQTGAWVTSGVVSIGPNRCGQTGIPGVYTNVKDYVPWIKRSMKP